MAFLKQRRKKLWPRPQSHLAEKLARNLGRMVFSIRRSPGL